MISGVLGLGAESLSGVQMALRALIVYVVAIVLVRLGEKRFLGKFTALDVILGIMLGSVLSRAITGQSPFYPTLVAALVLVVLHWLFAALAFRYDGFGGLVKGQERVLVREGEIQWDAMRKGHISRRDLDGALRTEANLADVSQVKEARLERSGEISVIKRDA